MPLTSNSSKVCLAPHHSHCGCCAACLITAQLPHITWRAGKETVRRLLDIPAACALVGVELELPDGLTSVTTVGELAKLLEATKGHSAVRGRGGYSWRCMPV